MLQAPNLGFVDLARGGGTVEDVADDDADDEYTVEDVDNASGTTVDVSGGDCVSSVVIPKMSPCAALPSSVLVGGCTTTDLTDGAAEDPAKELPWRPALYSSLSSVRSRYSSVPIVGSTVPMVACRLSFDL